MAKNQTKDQLDRFLEAAREVCADQSGDALDRAMGRLDLKTKSAPGRSIYPASTTPCDAAGDKEGRTDGT